MRICLATLESITPYSQSRAFQSEPNEKESKAKFEERCWREKAHANEAGEIFIPAMSLKYAVDEACKRLGLQIPGQGKTRYTKYFEAGQYCMEGPTIGIKVADVPGEWVYCNADGKRGSGTRVMRCFPVIAQWKATAKFAVLDEKIPEDVFEQCLRESGLYVGIGRFRPQNQGFYGRFKLVEAKWSSQ